MAVSRRVSVKRGAISASWQCLNMVLIWQSLFSTCGFACESREMSVIAFIISLTLLLYLMVPTKYSMSHRSLRTACSLFEDCWVSAWS